MSESAKDFAARYAGLSESQLMELARHYDTLVEPAQSALRAEFTHRNLEPPIIEEESIRPEFRKLVTMRHYRDLSAAIVARSLLEASNIPAYLFDDNLVRLSWQISNLIGGIRLQVDESDQEAAEEVLSQPVPEGISFGEEIEFSQPSCPVCSSIDITFEGTSRELRSHRFISFRFLSQLGKRPGFVIVAGYGGKMRKILRRNQLT